MRLIDLDELLKFPIRRNHCDKKNANPHFINGIETVFEYAEQLPTLGWIPVTERLPKPNVTVLVTYDYGWVCRVDRDVLNKDGTWCFLEWNCEVTHWMPLPTPPKDGDT